MNNPDKIKRYNIVQKELGGIPMDPCGNQDVDMVLEMIVEIIDSNDFYNDRQLIPGLLDHLLRAEGPYDNLNYDERQRVKQLLLEHYQLIE